MKIKYTVSLETSVMQEDPKDHWSHLSDEQIWDELVDAAISDVVLSMDVLIDEMDFRRFVQKVRSL